MGWIDWLRYVLTPLLIAVLGAAIATRNARKTPHERLKNLVDIHDKMKPGLDPHNVVETAIIRELVDFDRRVAADQRGFWAGVKERVVQLDPRITLAIAPLLLAAAILGVGGLISIFVDGVFDGSREAAAGTGFALIAGGLVALVLPVATRRLTRAGRQERRDELLDAEVAAQLTSEAHIRFVGRILEDGRFTPAHMGIPGIPRLVGRLRMLGLLDAEGHLSNPTYVVNNPGRRVLQRAYDNALSADDASEDDAAPPKTD